MLVNYKIITLQNKAVRAVAKDTKLFCKSLKPEVFKNVKKTVNNLFESV